MQVLFDRYSAFHRRAPDGSEYSTRTRRVRVARSVHHEVPAIVADFAPTGPVAVFFDENTHRAAGEGVVRVLKDAGREVREILLEPGTGEETVVCTGEAVATAYRALEANPCTHAVAVGAGTVNDIVKMGAFRARLDYTAVATAPSMNGYTSSIAAILDDGVKTTQPCNAPLAALADPEVMAAAPYRMIASGIGDLYSKPVSNADWRLGHRLVGTPHSAIVMEIVDAGSALLDGVAPRLPSRDVDAVAALTGAIMLSGLAMQAAGTSGPASGGEHLVSHYLDMRAIADGTPHDFHGCQVAVGTVATSALYERVRALDPRAIDVDARVDSLRAWEEYETTLAGRFGALTDAVATHARRNYPTPAALRQRLETVVANWDDLMTDVSATLRPSAELRDELDSAACPTSFAQVGAGPERAYEALAWSKDIRARYTILHLAADLGLLESFARNYVARDFDTSSSTA